MKFTITCKAFARLAGIPSFFEPRTDEEIKKQLSCIRIENCGGKVFAIATNQKVMAVELIGMTNEADCVAHITVDPELVKQCVNESLYDSFLEITYVPEILLATIKSMLGYTYLGNAAINGVPEQSALSQWRKWLPPASARSNKGPMYWGLDHIETLVKTSPSGKIVFPEFIDIDKPIIIRDTDNDNWFGVFIARPAPSQLTPEPAELPEWVK